MGFTIRFAAGLAALLLCQASMAQSHQAIRDQLFAQVDVAKKAADERKANVLAPVSYAEGMELYIEATELLEKGKDIDGVREGLVEATQYFERANEAAKLAEVTFATVLQAREAAERAEASRYVQRDWERAEDAFASAAERLEGGNLSKAVSDAPDIERRYREAEAGAISARTRAN